MYLACRLYADKFLAANADSQLPLQAPKLIAKFLGAINTTILVSRPCRLTPDNISDFR